MRPPHAHTQKPKILHICVDIRLALYNKNLINVNYKKNKNLINVETLRSMLLITKETLQTVLLTVPSIRCQY